MDKMIEFLTNADANNSNLTVKFELFSRMFFNVKIGEREAKLYLSNYSVEETYPILSIAAEKKIPTKIQMEEATASFEILCYIFRNFNLKHICVIGNRNQLSVIYNPELVFSEKQLKQIKDKTSDEPSALKSWKINIAESHSIDDRLLCVSVAGYEIMVSVHFYDSSYIVNNDQIVFELILDGKIAAKAKIKLLSDTKNIDLGVCNDVLWFRASEEGNIQFFRIYEIFEELGLDCLITHGMNDLVASWGKFCGKGLYDPRLFLLIAGFQGCFQKENNNIINPDPATQFWMNYKVQKRPMQIAFSSS